MKTVLVFCGASSETADGQATLARIVERARDRGIRTLLAASVAGGPGDARFFPGSPPEAGVWARTTFAATRIDAVCSVWKDTALHASYAARDLGLSGNPVDAVELTQTVFQDEDGESPLPAETKLYASGVFIDDRPQVIALISEDHDPGTGRLQGFVTPAVATAAQAYEVVAAVETRLLNLGLCSGYFRAACSLLDGVVHLQDVDLGIGPAWLTDMIERSLPDFDLVAILLDDLLGTGGELPRRDPKQVTLRWPGGPVGPDGPDGPKVPNGAGGPGGQ